MPLVETVNTEQYLREQIARLRVLIQRNPMTERDQTMRLNAAQQELNNLLLSQPGYEVTKTSAVDDARAEGYAAGHAAAKAEIDAALK
jgi:hypothetical protein